MKWKGQEKEGSLQYDEVENFNNFENQTTSRANAQGQEGRLAGAGRRGKEASLHHK